MDNAKAYFDADYTISGRETYKNVGFEFIYDNQTGYYEYKSSANHAQYDKESKKIKLYADTLSTENNSSPSAVGLQYGTGTNDLTVTSASKNLWKATLKDDGVNRFDPYVSFTKDSSGKALSLNAKNVNQIYIKAKIPAGIGTNKMQVFFQNEDGGYHENRSFLIDYAATGEWIEFVIDTAKDQNGKNTWTGTVTGLRLDLFDGNKGTFDTTTSYDVEVSEITFIKTKETHQTWGGFYPFTDNTETYPGNSKEPFTFENWADVIADSDNATALATRSMGNPSLAGTNLTEELAFGTVMEFDFYIPVGTPDDDLTYYFNGDDDLWVFVDDILVLDIGGGHGAISGTVNFTKGTSKVANAVKVDGYSSNEGSAKEVSKTLASDLTSAGKHTMKIFYMERCGSVSNCHMKFNLPQIPEGSVQVSKTLELENYDTGSDESAVLASEEFEFKISAKDTLSGTPDQDISLSYIIQSSDATTSELVNIQNGKTFKLKHGQTAYFAVPEGYRVTVTEEPHMISGYEWKSTTVNGSENPTYSATLTTAANTTVEFPFVNCYKEMPVTYTYIPVNPDDCPNDVKGKVGLTGNTDGATYDSQGVSETVGMRLGDPAGSTPTGSTAVKFVGWYLDAECTTEVDSAKASITDDVINPVQENGLYTGGTFYAKFEYMYGDLTITKSGIKDVDHHEQNDYGEEEKQSAIFRVTGTSESGMEIDMEVVICGNDCITIKHLPVGTYTVTEITDWSWRYEPDPDSQNTSVQDSETSGLLFKNNREENDWLSGDSYAQNWWKTLNSVIRKEDSSDEITKTFY